MILKKIIRDGNFTPLVRGGLCFAGIVVGMVGLKYDRTLVIALTGLLIAAVGGYSSRAHMFDIKPFDSSYRKARNSYQVKGNDKSSEENK